MQGATQAEGHYLPQIWVVVSSLRLKDDRALTLGLSPLPTTTELYEPWLIRNVLSQFWTEV